MVFISSLERFLISCVYTIGWHQNQPFIERCIMRLPLNIRVVYVTVFVFLFSCTSANDLNVGDQSTAFSAMADNGTMWKAADMLGKKNLVVYFYPAAMTGGCTKQACAYRDDLTKLDSLDAVIVGVSGDAVKNLQLFKEAHKLNFTLLSDPDGKIAGLFGVPNSKGEKTIEREINGIKYDLTRASTSSRWTFVLDKKGKVVYKSTEVNAAEDSKAVLEVLKGM